jgi:YD repeat-containing protein
MHALIRTLRVFALIISSLIALGQNVKAQTTMPEGTKGWWYFVSLGVGGYAPDAVTACQYDAVNHMGTWLVAMRPTAGVTYPAYDCKYPHFIQAGGVQWYTFTWLECEYGYVSRWPGVCTKIVEQPLPPSCKPADQGAARGNPVVVATGDKVQVEIDVIGGPQNPLQVVRTYRTFAEWRGALGGRWSFDFDRTLTTSSDTSGQPPDQVSGMGDQGSTFTFFHAYTSVYVPTSARSGTLAPANALYDEWIYKNTSGRIDRFKKLNGTYKLVSSHTKEGVGQYFAYDTNNRLQSITDSFGRALQVVWKNDYVVDSIIGPDLTAHYEYDLAAIPSGALIEGSERLVKVLMKDAGGTVLSTKEYHYEDPRQRVLLTGITDENASRYATYAYDDAAKAVLSEHAGGADRNSFSYTSDLSRTVTDALGTSRIISLVSLPSLTGKTFGRTTSISQPGGAGCGPAASSFTYDGNSNLSSISDFNGNKTCYATDSVRILETGRIEGVDGAAACPSISTNSLSGNQRKILTQWHPDLGVEVKISGPKKRTSYIYNGQADVNGQILTCAPSTSLPDGKPIMVLCKRIEQATSDSNGAAGFNAVPIGQPRIWTFTYNALGQVLTSVGPAGDSGSTETTTYTYYADTTATHTSGDLWTVTNAKGHLTEYLEYNKSGNNTRMRDPNGNITVLTYDPQLRLTSRTVGAGTAAAQTTTYAYDGVGQLVKVTAPDASFITYTYDAAHRLTDVSDGLGNTIHYTLDNSGNRVREEVKDASGNLSRQVIRTYDPLNRLQEVTGAAR